MWRVLICSWMAIGCGADTSPSSELSAVTKFRLASYYSDHMVLQRAPARAVIWGYAPLDDIVVVRLSLSNLTYTERVERKDPDTGEGIWQISLDPVSKASSVSVVVSLLSESQPEVTLKDVIFGDVWICSGQSNMQFRVAQVFNASEEFASSSQYQDIRVLSVARIPSTKPLNDLKGLSESWMRSSPESLGQNNSNYFSSVCWLFAKYVYQHEKTPLGLVESDWGGTPIRAWSPPDVIRKCGEPPNKLMQASDKIHSTLRNTDERELKDVPHAASVLWNGMIRPLRNMTIFGALWYQGEADAGSPNRYNCTFPAMIDAWRREFSQASQQTNSLFPFGFVQLGPFRNNTSFVGGFPVIRNALTADFGYVPNARQRNVFMSVALDLRDDASPYGSIHYRDKQDAALRLSYSARAIVYGDTVHHRFPFPESIKIDQKGVLINYDINQNVINEVVVDPSKGGFEVMCSNGAWIPCPIYQQASETSLYLRCTCPSASAKITGARYLWRETPCATKQCAVYSKVNALPAAPFSLPIPMSASSKDVKWRDAKSKFRQPSVNILR